jgi:hypothetical protein
MLRLEKSGNPAQQQPGPKNVELTVAMAPVQTSIADWIFSSNKSLSADSENFINIMQTSCC